MNALRHEFDLADAIMLPPGAEALPEWPDPVHLADQWDAVHEAAAAVARLAQLDTEDRKDECFADLPARALRRGGHAYAMVARGVEDLAAVMQPGLRALLALTAQGRDTTAAAQTLWREFHAARTALLEFAAAE